MSVKSRAVLTVLLAFCLGVYGAPKRKKAKPNQKATAAKVQTPPPVNATAVNNNATADEVKADSAGSAVARAQILLDRAHYSPGEIDGHYGDNLQTAVRGYQAAHQLPVTGNVSADTWRLLNADSAPALVPYMIAPDDVAGPFEPIPTDMPDKAKLKALGFTSPQEALGERFHIDPKLLAELNPGKDLSKAGEEILVPNVQREFLLPADRVVVSKAQRTVTALGADGRILAQYPATIGSEHDPLPIGDWKVKLVQQNPWYNYNPALFYDADASDTKARIAPGPNNPVGAVWIGLTKEHYGIHGTPEPGTVGHTTSHGCIRLTNWDAKELSQMVKTATPVILQE